MTFLKITIALLAAAACLSAAEQPMSVAVFDFESREESIKDLGTKVSSLLSAQLSLDPGLIMVERAEIDKALGEQELGLSGAVSTATAARVGNLTGAKVLVSGRAFRVEKDTMIVAKIIGSETGRVYAESARLTPTSDLSLLCTELAKKIATDIASKANTLVATVQSRTERIDHLVASAKPAQPTSVSVRIPEQHFGSPTVDPAAQTQLLAIFRQAGFEIVDDKSDRRADIEVTGEAFSSLGFRKGNIFFCKSRLELTARRRGAGKILYTGSQTSVAMDITQETAAKTALENTAVDLAGPLLTIIAKADHK